MTKNNEMLKILILGNLDIKSTAYEINNQLKQLKLTNLNLKVNIDLGDASKKTSSLKNDALSYQKWWEQVLQRQELERERVLQSEHRTRSALERKAAQERESALREEQRIRKALEDQRIKEEQRVSKEREKALQEEQKLRRKIDQEQSKQQKTQQQNQSAVNLFQDKAKYNADRLLQNLGKSVDKRALQEWLNEVDKLTSKTPKLQQEIARLNERFRQISTSASDAGRRTFDLGQQMEHAFKKIALWTAAGGIFFGAQTALRSLLSVIVEVDTKLTELSKVMSNDTDFSKLMSNTMELANTYGRSLTEAQDSLIEFGKAGYEAEEALKLTNATLLGANVTGLKTGQMAEYLTGALIQFNLTAEESTRVIDKLNEVDNNYSVTSLGLAQSIAKAGESAQAFGVTLDELIGMTTAIGQATRESGNVIGRVAA
ncbi:phage tail tape measure protein [Brevibacillus sp. NRS-1366]|uniref:phage tail tape measure protein n=1 Tax=Brevibacillus sp. NRS-1366 TaxID=3233899 RepID=UPI003D1AE82F